MGGIVDQSWDPKALVACFDQGINDGIWQHTNIHDLAKYSDFVKFVIKLRPMFMSEFEKYKLCFPGCNGESLFVGTVLHSLDHTLMEINMADPLWLDTTDPKYGLMAELGQVVRVGFIPDVPGLYFHKQQQHNSANTTTNNQRQHPFLLFFFYIFLPRKASRRTFACNHFDSIKYSAILHPFILCTIH